VAAVINEWPTVSRTRKSRYPWDEWTNGSIWQAKVGEDFDTSVKTFSQGLYAYGKRHGMKTEVRTVDDTTVAFCFFPGEQVATPAEAPAA
jgi:hypothetical protein